MTGVNNLKNIPAYATEADPNYTYDTAEALQQAAPENYAQGFQPLETLPARWYNAMLHALSVQAQATFQLCTSMFNELKTVIEASGQDMEASRINQLKEAIATLTKLEVATATKLGGVKSSADTWKIAVNPDTGVMSLNYLAASTTNIGLVQLNDTLTSSSTTLALTAAQGKALKDTINALDYSSPTASGNSTSFIDTISQTDGKISATKKTIPSAARNVAGLVTLPSGTGTTKYLREDGTWYVPPDTDTHSTWYLYLKVEDGKLYATVSTGTAPTGYTLGTTGVTLPITTHATSATYLRPADSTSTAVTADSSGNLSAHTLELS